MFMGSREAADKFFEEHPEPEFDRHEPGFRKHDVKLKRNNRRGKPKQPHRNTVPVQPAEQEER
jgi:hypothetical protein